MRKGTRRRQTRQLPLVDVPPQRLDYYEEALLAEGFRAIAGVDEAGRGCLAGPVVAAAVVLPPAHTLQDLRDSKQLTAAQRDRFFDLIQERARSVAVGIVGPGEIDATDILKASLKAMRIAVEGLGLLPDYLLVDGPFGIGSPLPQRAIKKGDARSFSIAAASVIAKVTRDRMMADLERSYPAFQFTVHKGYGTELHLAELAKHGPTPIHRKTFTVQGRSLRDMMKGERKTWRS